MDSKKFDSIIEIINSNSKLSRDQVYNLVLDRIKISNNETKCNVLLTNGEKLLPVKDENDESSATIHRQIYNTNQEETNNNSNNLPVQLDYNAFVSIYSNFKRRQMFRTSMWRKLKEKSLEFVNKYNKESQLQQENQMKKFPNIASRIESNIIVNMAKEINISPVLMARLIVEGMLKTNSLELVNYDNENKDDDENYDEINDEKDQSNKKTNFKESKISITNIIRDTHRIKDGRLACEIMECCAIDEDYGPIIDIIKNMSGYEYEYKLESILNEKGIFFKKESELREKGYDKTPDFVLEFPIYLKKFGRIISWIDSKGTFGDKTSHNEYYEAQFKYYLNRFGSGLVIYWLGHVKEIEYIYNNITHRTIVVCDHFPDEITYLDLDPLIDNLDI